jgi:glycosyltransferase involved in cell wall biosynthesis
MKVFHYSGDKTGGAGRAALRLHQALLSAGDIESTLIAQSVHDQSMGVRVLDTSVASQIKSLVRPGLDRIPARFLKGATSVPRSPSWLSAMTADAINESDADIIHLHWTGAGFLSIENIGKIKKPVVWTLHDMWGFCGSEHLAPDDANARWRHGYDTASRGIDLRGFDVDRWTWQRKRRAWRLPMHVVAPSRWLANCASHSTLMREWPVSVIPNVLNTERYKPVPKVQARDVLNLPQDKKLILFGAIKGTQMPHKGWDLLMPALQSVADIWGDVEAVIFGQSAPAVEPEIGMKLNWMGHIFDDATLALLYSAADLIVVPSRQEAFGQTASEAQACGCPVVGFDATGIRDVVEHGVTGYLAKPYEVADLVRGIRSVVESQNCDDRIRQKARARAVALWSQNVVAKLYEEVYVGALR